MCLAYKQPPHLSLLSGFLAIWLLWRNCIQWASHPDKHCHPTTQPCQNWSNTHVPIVVPPMMSFIGAALFTSLSVRWQLWDSNLASLYMESDKSTRFFSYSLLQCCPSLCPFFLPRGFYIPPCIYFSILHIHSYPLNPDTLVCITSPTPTPLPPCFTCSRQSKYSTISSHTTSTYLLVYLSLLHPFQPNSLQKL